MDQVVESLTLTAVKAGTFVSTVNTVTDATGSGGVEDELLVPNSYTFYGETSVVALLLLIGSTLNGPLLYVYCVSNQARSIADRFLINLILADILSLVLLLPTIIVDLFLLERHEEDLFRNMTRYYEVIEVDQFAPGSGMRLGPEIGLPTIAMSIDSTGPNIVMGAASGGGEMEMWDWSCTFKKCLFSGIATASILSTLEIAMERYLAIVTPLHYHKFLTKYKVLMTSFGGGLIAMGSAVLSALDPCEPVFPSCTRTTVAYTSAFWWPLYTLGHVTLFFILPVVCMACIYVRIWLEARRQKAKISSRYKKPFFLHVTPSNPSADRLKDRTKFFLHPVVLRFRFIDRFVTARMDRAARVAICTLMVTIVCWSPYYFVQCAHSIRSIVEQLKGQVRVRESWSHLESTVPLLAASLHPVMAPFFYGYRYTIIRDRVFMLFGLDRWYPAIRDRRSNSVSQYRSPTRSVRFPNCIDSLEAYATQNADQGDNNNQQWKQALDTHLQQNEVETIEGKHGNGHTIITIAEPHSQEDQVVGRGANDEPHPFLFTIGAADADEEESVADSYLPPQGPSVRFHGYDELKPPPTLFEYSSGSSNCSSSEALLGHHHYYEPCASSGSFLYDDGPSPVLDPDVGIYPNYERCYESCCESHTASTSNQHTAGSSIISPNPIQTQMDGLVPPSHTVVQHGHCLPLPEWSSRIQEMLQRWGAHRQSVSSNSSVVTLLSSRSISSEYLPS